VARSLTSTRRRYQAGACLPVVSVFGTLYALAAPFEDPTQRFDAYLWIAAAFAVPTALWLVGTWLLVGRWWEVAGARWVGADAPAQVLGTVTATLPAHRSRWGTAMLHELAAVHGRAARWRFAVSCLRAGLFLPIVSRPPGRRSRLPSPVAALVVASAVAAAFVTTVFVQRHPDAREGLPANRIALLVVALILCLCLALGMPAGAASGPAGSRNVDARWGVGAGVAFALGLLVAIHSDLDGLVLVWLLYGPGLTFTTAAYAAAASRHSFRAGLRAGAWTAVTVMPLTFAILLDAASRQYTDDGQWLFAGDVTTAAFTVTAALVTIVAVPVLGLPFAVIGATAGARRGAAKAAHVSTLRAK
jgi:hypothetical protein